MTKSFNLILLFLISTILFNSCKKRCDFSGSHEFEIPITLSPALDTYSIGDTIKIFSEFSDQVYDRKSELEYNLVNFKFFPLFCLNQIDILPVDRAALHSFERIVPNEYDFDLHDFNDSLSSYIGEYNYEDGRYQLEISIIPQKKGIFHMEFGAAIYPIGKDQDFDGKCKKTDSDSFSNLNNGANNNIELLSQSPDEHFNTWMLNKPEDRFHKFGGYCFNVIE